MQELSMDLVREVNGGGAYGDISAGLGAAAAVAGGLAAVPTPASGALAGFAVVTGVLSAGAGWLESRYPLEARATSQ